MEENIQSSESEVSIVIYDSPLPPRYLKISRKLLKTILVFLPILLGTLLLATTAYIVYPYILKSPAPNLPRILSAEERKIIELEKLNQELSESNKTLQTKISQSSSDDTASEGGYLLGIKKPYGMRDLTESKRIHLENISITSKNNKTSFNFQIVSNDPSRRIAGNVFAYIIHTNGFHAYPQHVMKNITQGIKFNEGEPFAMSRLRPTTAEFNVNLENESVKYVIYIFNREGDLLYYQESDLVKVTTGAQ